MSRISGSPAPAVVQTVYSADGTVYSTSSATMAASGSSVTITGVKPGNTLRVRAVLTVGTTGNNVGHAEIRRGTTDITPGGKTCLGGFAMDNSNSQLTSYPFMVDDTGHGGGSVTYNLYFASGNTTQLFLGRDWNNVNTGPSVVWVVEEIAK